MYLKEFLRKEKLAVPTRIKKYNVTFDSFFLKQNILSKNLLLFLPTNRVVSLNFN